MGCRFHIVTEDEANAHVIGSLEQGRGGWVHTVNLDILRLLVTDSDFRETCSGVDLSVADGMPPVWASKLQGTPLPERVAGSSMVTTLTGEAATAGRSVYFLGGNPGAAEAAIEVLKEKFPELEVAGVECPDFGFEKDEEGMKAMSKRLANSGADIVYIALGVPKQEKLIAELRNVLPKAWWIGIGISFSYVSGDVKRAPALIRSLGLEWVYRMAQEPKRLVQRYLVEDLPFAGRLFASALAARVSGNSGGGC